jgi:hypothetical protein
MTPIVTNEAAMNVMLAKQADLALSVLRLATNAIGTITPTTTKAALVAAEATFTGYLAKTITAFLTPYIDPAGGVSMQAPTQQFDDTGTAIQEMIRAWWLESATGEIQVVAQFDNDIPMSDVGNSIPIDVKFNQPN